MDTYCDIYGDSWSFSCRKAGASAAVGRECRRTETFYLGSACRKYHRNASDRSKWWRYGVFIRIPYGKRGDRCLRREIHSICRRKNAGSLYVQVPEKETEKSGEEPETEKELSEEQQREKELQDMIVQYNQKKNDPRYYYLPEEWNGKHLEWEQPKDTTGNLISALGLVAAAAVVIAKRREEESVQIKRREQMLMDYPGLVMKFTLLVQAGLTARKAFQKIAMDYGKREEGNKRAAYEEIRTACYEMDSGVSEAEAYRRFGERCGQVKYKTLSTLLIQNLQKGSRYLSDLLEKESVEAWEERKRKARVLGEAAATKLLLPMVLMLLVVMAVIMLPACLSFYGG